MPRKVDRSGTTAPVVRNLTSKHACNRLEAGVVIAVNLDVFDRRVSFHEALLQRSTQKGDPLAQLGSAVASQGYFGIAWMIEEQAKRSRARRLNHVDTIETNDAASMRLKEDLVVELCCQGGERSVDRETVHFRHSPDELAAGLEVDDVPYLDHDVRVFPAYREPFETPGAGDGPRAPGGHTFERLPKPLESDRLEQVVGDLCLEAADGAIVVRGYDDDVEIGVFLAKNVRQSEAVQAGHAKIDESDLRLRVVAKSLCFHREFGFTHDIDPFALTEEERQLVSRERLIIDDDRPKGHACPCGAASQLSSSPVMMRGASRSPSTVSVPVNSITDRSSCTISSR